MVFINFILDCNYFYVGICTVYYIHFVTFSFFSYIKVFYIKNTFNFGRFLTSKKWFFSNSDSFQKLNKVTTLQMGPRSKSIQVLRSVYFMSNFKLFWIILTCHYIITLEKKV